MNAPTVERPQKGSQPSETLHETIRSRSRAPDLYRTPLAACLRRDKSCLRTGGARLFFPTPKPNDAEKRGREKEKGCWGDSETEGLISSTSKHRFLPAEAAKRGQQQQQPARRSGKHGSLYKMTEERELRGGSVKNPPFSAFYQVTTRSLRA